MTTLVTDADFEGQVLNADEPVLVDFFAEWCGPCKMQSPVLEELAGDYQGRAKVVKLDVDNSPQTAQQFGIRSIPTLMVFKNGAPQDTLIGLQAKGVLEGVLDRQLS